MSKSENVKIPLSLLLRIIALLEYWDIAKYDPVIQNDYDNVYGALVQKRQRLELRETYSKIVCAETEDARHFARIEYLRQKRLVDEN